MISGKYIARQFDKLLLCTVADGFSYRKIRTDISKLAKKGERLFGSCNCFAIVFLCLQLR